MGHDNLQSGALNPASPVLCTGRGADTGHVPSLSAALPAAPPGPWPVHGGPGAQGAARHDFSTNSNACGPCPQALAAVQQADATRYPDPAYTALRAQLGAFHGVAPERIVLAASASEFIHRMTALAAQQGAKAVALPAHSYGDYAQAALARGLQVLRPADALWSAALQAGAGLQWACEPSSPLGGACPVQAVWRTGPAEPAEHTDAVRTGQVLLPRPLGEGRGEGQQPWRPHSAENLHLSSNPPKAGGLRRAPIPAFPQRGKEPSQQPFRHPIAFTPSPSPLRIHDCAYMPLRLHTEGSARLNSDHAFALPELVPATWQLWTPNKALGLTGVRAAYAIAPEGADALVAALTALAPSWPVGAHGVALLHSWVQPATQRWLAGCLPVLRDWKARQQALCAALGWAVLPGSQANYFCVRLPTALQAASAAGQLQQKEQQRLRTHGIQVRDCSSFGLPGHWRLGVLPPPAQAALWRACKHRH